MARHALSVFRAESRSVRVPICLNITETGWLQPIDPTNRFRWTGYGPSFDTLLTLAAQNDLESFLHRGVPEATFGVRARLIETRGVLKSSDERRL